MDMTTKNTKKAESGKRKAERYTNPSPFQGEGKGGGIFLRSSAWEK